VYGGLRYLANVDGTPTNPSSADHKLWWPHAEALYALLLGWAITGRDDLAAWYHRVHEYAFDRFPDRQYGEWYGYLNRDGSVIFTAKANGAKGFFHLPRVFLRIAMLLEQAGSEASRSSVPP
jgi:N-acylglucosamine 2-epimerase